MAKTMHRKRVEFMSRGEYMKDCVKFPENHRGLVVIPSNLGGTGFLRTCYDEKILGKRISDEEFTQIIDQASGIVAKVFSQKRNADDTGITKHKILLLYFSIIAGSLFIAFNLHALKTDNGSLELFSYILFGAAYLIVFSIGVYEFMRKSERNFLSFNSLVKLQLDEYFEKINSDCYLDRGLEWYVTDGHYWIELHVTEPLNRDAKILRQDSGEMDSDVISSDDSEEGEAEQEEHSGEMSMKQSTKMRKNHNEPEEEDEYPM